jgi:hypothetical protein
MPSFEHYYKYIVFLKVIYKIYKFEWCQLTRFSPSTSTAGYIKTHKYSLLIFSFSFFQLLHLQKAMWGPYYPMQMMHCAI